MTFESNPTWHIPGPLTRYFGTGLQMSEILTYFEYYLCVLSAFVNILILNSKNINMRGFF